MADISANIKKLREERKLTQAELGRLTQVDEKYISAIERGVREPGKRLIAKLCEALAVDELTLRFGERETEPPQVPEHVRRLHNEINRVFLSEKDDAEQLILAGKILKMLQGKD